MSARKLLTKRPAVPTPVRAPKKASFAPPPPDPTADAAAPPPDTLIILAYLHDAGRCGVALFSSETESIHASSLPCTPTEQPFVISALLSTLPQPTLVLASSSVTEAARWALGWGAGSGVLPGAMPPGAETLPVKVVPAKSFSLEVALSLIPSLVTGPGVARPRAGLGVGPATLGLDPHDTLAARATGGLLSFLTSNSQLEVADGGAPVLRGGLLPLSTDGFLQIDALSMAALSVFPTATGAGGGLSLLGMLDGCASAPGKRSLRGFLARPSTSLQLLNERHDTVAFLFAAGRWWPGEWKSLRTAQRHLRDPAALLLRVKRQHAGVSDWAGLRDSVGAALKIVSIVRGMLVGVPGGAPSSPDDTEAPSCSESPSILRALLGAVKPELHELASTLDNVIDWQTSKSEGALTVRNGVSAQLDAVRATYADLQSLLTAESASELAKDPSLMQLTLQYVPQVGVVAVVDRRANGMGNSAPGTPFTPQATAIPPEFTLLFEAAEDLTFKSPRCEELDAQFGDIGSALLDAEAAILRAVVDAALSCEPALVDCGGRLADMDALCAFAEVADAQEWVRPSLVDYPCILIKGARHPLQAAVVEGAFVPNDVGLLPGTGSPIAIVTGANGSVRERRAGRCEGVQHAA